MLWLEIIVLAVIQGIGEFLPISSSGHVVVGEAVFQEFGTEISEKLTVNIALHFGTLLSILVFFWRRIWQLLNEDRRVIWLIVVGSLPAAFAGLVLKKQFEAAFEQPIIAGLMFPVTAVMLLWASRHDKGQTPCRELSTSGALVVGVLQAFAILPGVSRSGATIMAGLGVGLRREDAATFSFLLAIPAIGGATLLELRQLLTGHANDVSLAALGVGVVVSCVVGLASLAVLMRCLREGRLSIFAWWLIPLGIAVIVWQLVRLLAMH